MKSICYILTIEFLQLNEGLKFHYIMDNVTKWFVSLFSVHVAHNNCKIYAYVVKEETQNSIREDRNANYETCNVKSAMHCTTVWSTKFKV